MVAPRRMLLLAATGLALAVALPAAAADDPGVIPLRIQLGRSAPVGPGPVRNLICDDASIVQPVDTPSGPALKGIQPGTTLCSLMDVMSVRRVYRVVVFTTPDGSSSGRPGDGG